MSQACPIEEELDSARTKGFDKNAGEVMEVDEKLTPKEERQMLKDFVEHFKLGYRVAMLAPKNYEEVSGKYKVDGIPHVVLIDRKGKIRLVKVGATEENTEAIDRTVKELLDEEG